MMFDMIKAIFSGEDFDILAVVDSIFGVIRSILRLDEERYL